MILWGKWPFWHQLVNLQYLFPERHAFCKNPISALISLIAYVPTTVNHFLCCPCIFFRVCIKCFGFKVFWDLQCWMHLGLDLSPVFTAAKKDVGLCVFTCFYYQTCALITNSRYPIMKTVYNIVNYYSRLIFMLYWSFLYVYNFWSFSIIF